MAEIRFRMNDKEGSLDVDKLMFSEGRAIERVTGKTLKAAMEALGEGSIEAMQAVVWTALRRSNPGLQFSDLDDAAIGDVEILEDEPDAGVPDAVDPPVGPDGPDDTNL